VASKRPLVFIGSSSEGKEIAEHLQLALEPVADCEVWDQGVFELGGDALGSLLKAAERFDFGVFVMTADDQVTKRGEVSMVPRDNVVLELGLFLGSVGRQRSIIVLERAGVAFPSDLAGITVAQFRRRDPRNPRAEVGPAATLIKERVSELGIKAISKPPPPAPGSRRSAFRFATDLLAGLRTGAAGVSVIGSDESAQRTWRNTLLGALGQEFSSRSDDCYTMWLAPPAGSTRLQIALVNNLPEGDDPSIYRFAAEEGLIGNAWFRGVAAHHSAEDPNDWWSYREGCPSESYICAPLGSPGSPAGMLAVGSLKGFAIEDDDVELVRLFAALLAATLETGAANAATAALKPRVTALDGSLAAYAVSRPAGDRELITFNALLSLAKAAKPEDPLLQTIQELSVADFPDIGEVRLLLQQILAAL
jgi:hypothetical protein